MQPEFSFSDGGELKCGICNRVCLTHYRLHDVLDIGLCCLPDMHLAALAGCTQREAVAMIGTRSVGGR